MAVPHIFEARRVVEVQRQRIAKLKERGRPTLKHEQTFQALKCALQVFLNEERKIRRGHADKPA
jgi:hypothetical protein